MSQTAAPASRRGTPGTAVSPQSPMSPTSPKKTLYGKSSVAGAMEMLKKIKAQGAEVANIEAARDEVEADLNAQQDRVVAQKRDLGDLNKRMDLLKDELAQSTWALLAYRDSTDDAQDANTPKPSLSISLDRLQTQTLQKQGEGKLLELRNMVEERRNTRLGTRLRLVNQLLAKAASSPTTQTYAEVGKAVSDLGNTQLKDMQGRQAACLTARSELNSELSVSQRRLIEIKQASKASNKDDNYLMNQAGTHKNSLMSMLTELEKPVDILSDDNGDELTNAIANEEEIESKQVAQHTENMAAMNTKVKEIQAQVAQNFSAGVLETVETRDEDLYQTNIDLREVQNKILELKRLRGKLPNGVVQEYETLVEELKDLQATP